MGRLDTSSLAVPILTMPASSEPARNRGPGRPFQPGVSGNPSGLSKEIAPLVAEARRLALSHAPKAIETLAALLDDEDPRVRVAAAEGLLDRAGLRPYSLEPERVEVTAVPVDVDALRSALAARVEALAAAAGVGEPRALAPAPAASECVAGDAE